MPALNRYWAYVASVGLLLLLALAPAQAQSDAAPALDVVFALDLSGSLYVDLARTFGDDGIVNVDRGALLYGQVGALPLPATDREGYRFDVVRFASQWLATFFDEDAPAGLRIGVVGFNHAAPLVTLPLTPVTALTPEQLAQLEPPRPALPSHSDFYSLYERLAQPDLLGDPTRARLLVLLTDSVPCGVGLDRAAAGVTIRDGDCRNPALMQTHLRESIALLSEVDQVVVHLSPESYWAASNLGSVRQAWQDALAALGGNSGFFQAATPADIPRYMLGPLVDELAFASTGQRDGAALGVLRVDDERFVVPPYQAALDVVTVADNVADIPPLLGPDGAAVTSATPMLTPSRQLQVRRVAQPTAGTWRYAGQPPYWVRYTPAQADLYWQSLVGTRIDQPVQHDTLQVRYDLRAGDRPLLTDAYPPQVEVTLTSPTATQAITMTATNAGFVSEPLYLDEAGAYELALRATPGDDWPGVDEAIFDPAFLQTPGALRVTVAPLQVNASLGDIAQQIALRQASTIEILRSARVPVRITAEAEGRTVPVPTELEAALQLDGPGCAPEMATALVWQGGAFTVPGGLQFNIGRCDVGVALRALPPNGPAQTVYEAFLGTVESGATERLTLALLAPDGAVIPPDDPAFVVTVPDRSLGTPQFSSVAPYVQWPSGLGELRLRFRNEAGTAVAPAFVGGPDVVPFSATVTRERLAGATTIYSTALRRTARPGLYTLVIDPLPPGDYRLDLTLLTDGEAALAVPYEYAPSLFPAGSPTLRYSVLLRVTNNWPLTVLTVGGALLLAGALLVSAWLLFRRHRLRAHPLRGALALYHRPEGAQHAREIWRAPLPPDGARRNRHVFERAAVTTPETLRIPLLGIAATTKGRRELAQAGGAWVRVHTGTGWSAERELRPGPLHRYEFTPGFILVILSDVDAAPLDEEV